MKDYAQTLSNIGENKYFKWDGSILIILNVVL